MRTESINWSVNQTHTEPVTGRMSPINTPRPAEVREAVSSMIETATGHLVRGTVATMVVIGILVAAIWATDTLAATGVVQAVIWAGAFVFLGLAVESSAATFKPLLATGLALGTISLLGAAQNMALVIIAAALIAAWTAWAILRDRVDG